MVLRFLLGALCSLLILGGGVFAFLPANAQQSIVDEGFLQNFLRGSQTSENKAEAPRRRVPFSSEEIQLSFAPLVRETAPAVVNVYASSRVRSRSPFLGDPFFERFFDLPQMPPRVQSSLGSGVLVDPSGIIVTNYHVIRAADEVKVALSDGREFSSEILLQDEKLDLAILDIDGSEPYPAAQFGDSEALQVGDLVLAIGNPFGVGQTTTSGIVSALARTPDGISDFGFFIQTDAAVNPGNSGGALINMSGEVVGINTAIYSRSGGSNGIGFAIPANIVRSVVDAAKDGEEYFQRPYVGARFDRVTPNIAEALGMERPMGAMVTDVAAESPAQEAGLKSGDVVMGVNGKPVETPEALEYRIATLSVGDIAEIEILRSDEHQQLRLPIRRAPEGRGREAQIGGNGPFAGVRVSALSPALSQRLNLSTDEQGVVIVAVDRNSPAARIGLRPGDIVRELNGEEVTNVERMKELTESDSRWWRFTIERGGRIIRQTMRF